MFRSTVFFWETWCVKSNLSHPAFKLIKITKLVGKLEGFKILTKYMPLNCLLSVVLCWCHRCRRPYQKHSWSKRNGNYYNLLYFLLLLKKVVCWLTLLHYCDFHRIEWLGVGYDPPCRIPAFLKFLDWCPH